MAHQYMGQLDDDVRDAVLGNAGTVITFRIGAPDAKVLSEELHDTFAIEDLVNLPNHSVYLRLMANGVPVPPLSADTLPPSN
jgi:hypothetical protein